jgi:hypothetical protein
MSEDDNTRTGKRSPGRIQRRGGEISLEPSRIRQDLRHVVGTNSGKKLEWAKTMLNLAALKRPAGLAKLARQARLQHVNL